MLNLKKPNSAFAIFTFFLIIIPVILLGNLSCANAADYVLPPFTLSPPPQSAPSATLHFEVHHFQITGNTVFPEAKLREITDAYQKGEITNADLEKLRNELNRYYYKKGYINSGVIFPEPISTEGELIVKVIEGRIIRIDVTGLTHLSAKYIKKRLKLGVGPPFNMNTMQARIRILHENPLIKRIRAEITPGGRLGEAVLKVNVEEASLYHAGVQLDNDHSPSVGSEQLTLYAMDNNLLGWGDALGARLGFTQGSHEISAYYDFPLTAKDLTLNLKFKTSESKVVEKPFDELDIHSEATDFSVGLSRPFFRTPQHTLMLALTAEKRHINTSLLGRGFSFSPGVQKGEADITVVRFSQQWFQPQINQVLALNSVFSIGINALDATQNETGPDGNFFAWSGQAQWIRRLPDLWKSQLVLSAELQLTGATLLPMEKFAIGGAGAGGVRGYRKNQLVKDNGVAASVELRTPVARLPLPLISKGAYDGTVSIAPFFDFGWADDIDQSDSETDTIYSLGLGLRWDISARVYAHIYYGHGFEEIENISRNLQDEGVHFEVRCDFF